MQHNNTVAFLIHPVCIETIRDNFDRIYKNFNFLQPIIKKISDKNLKSMYSLFPPHKFLEINNIISKNGDRLTLIIMMLPLFPSQMVTNDKSRTLQQILKCVELASRYGAKLISLGGFTSIITDQGREIADRINSKKIAITSGNTFTAALSINGIIKACEICKKEMSKLSLLVIGATGDIGSIVSKVLASKFKKIILSSRTIEKGHDIVKEVLKINKNTEISSHCSKELINSVDIVFVATSSVQSIIETDFLKNGLIIADVSIPANVSPTGRNDIFIFEAGRASVSFYNNLITDKTKFLFPKNSIYGCLAEALILGFEGRFENYSINRGEITPAKIDEIFSLGLKHGVSLSDFSFGDIKCTNVS